jgi:hypothetical protein
MRWYICFTSRKSWRIGAALAWYERLNCWRIGGKCKCSTRTSKCYAYLLACNGNTLSVMNVLKYYAFLPMLPISVMEMFSIILVLNVPASFQL